ncbi:MAG TPA: hypothetical protein VF096_08495 [Azonexus sp.]
MRNDAYYDDASDDLALGENSLSAEVVEMHGQSDVCGGKRMANIARGDEKGKHKIELPKMTIVSELIVSF